MPGRCRRDGNLALLDGAAVGLQHDFGVLDLLQGDTLGLVASTKSSLPTVRSKISRAFFGMTICPRSPMRTMPKMCLPRGGTGKPAASSLWVTRLSKVTPNSAARAWAFTRSGIDSAASHFATV